MEADRPKEPRQSEQCPTCGNTREQGYGKIGNSDCRHSWHAPKEPTAPTEDQDKHCFHGFIQDVDGDACVRCGRLEKSPIHHSELIGHVAQQGGKCWCGETHEAY